MTTITQTITTLPTAPDPATMTPTEFSAAAAAYVLAQKAMVPELNTWAGQVNTVGGEVATNAATATTKASEASASADASAASAIVAQGAANFVGLYSSLTGAKTAGISAEYQGAIWILNTNSANITADVPGVSSKWTRAYGGGIIYPRTSNIEFVAEDNGKIFEYTSGTFSQAFDAAATLKEGWCVYLYNTGTGIVTLDPDGAELIDGASTKVLPKDALTLVICTGTAFDTITTLMPLADNHVTVTTGNGHGSTNTKIRRFTTTLSSAGSAITYADSGTAGGSFTINEAGLYEISYTDGGGDSNVQHGIGLSLNSAELTTAIESVTAANRIDMAIAYNPSGGAAAAINMCVTRRLAAADVVRAHGGLSLPNNTGAAYTRLSIRKVGAL